nr:MAG: hypothetical protein [Bacteriophage sp.]UWI15401.1 MAG: hypothetical protein [Bacteriophage sp.]
MPRKDKVIHISNLPSTFRGNITRNGRFIQNGIPPLGGAYDKVAKSTGLIRLGNEFLYNGVNNLVSKDNREKLMNNTAGRLINYVKDFNKESLPSDDELGPTFPFNIIQTTRSNGRNLPQKQYAVGGKIPNVVAGGIAQPLGNNFFYMNGRKHSQGGIDIGPSDKTGIEVEDGEVVETNGNELKVYSAQPIINGISPARLVMGGANPNKVFQAQENFKDRNGINDDGTKAQYGITKEGEGLFDKIDNYADIAEKTLAIPNMATSTATLLAPNPYTAVASYITGLGGAAIDVYQLSRALYKKDYPNVVKNAIDIGTSIIGLRALRNAKKLRELDKVLRTSGADREIVHKTIGRTTKTKRTIYMTKEANKASNYEAVGYTAIPFSSALNLADTDDANNKKKLGGKNMIVNISGNVKNGLIHSPSSTGGLRDKFAVGGTRINRHGRTWEYDEQIGAYVPITNRTISRTSAYPINKSARGETIVGSDYTFRNGKWSKNSIINNNVNNNTNKSNIDNGNRRPQYYAERRLPLFEDGAGITSGLVRAGWSHGNNKGVSINNTNIPSLSATKSSGKTPRRGRSKSNQSTQSIPTKTPPIAVYNRNLPKVEANIPTTLPVSTSTPAKGTTSSDGKGQGKFKNITAADWIGLGSNMAGSLASYFASRRAINKMRGPGQPTLISANKLKTKYNINPQLDRIREDKFEAYRDIDSNTASSRVSLARKQRVRNAAGQAANELYGNKENIETNLINQDRRNQQSVRQFNAQQYNQYIDRKAAFDNGIREAKVTNINNLFSGINAGIQDMISRYENRKALNNTISAMRASAPNVDDRIMRDAGVDYDEFIIRKRRKLGGKQSCR